MTTLQMWSHQGRAEVEKNLPRPAGHTVLDAQRRPWGIREEAENRKAARIQHRKAKRLWFLTCSKDLVIWVLLRLLYKSMDKMKDNLIYSSHLENPKISYSLRC